jgi:uncharacterized protein
MNIPFRVFVSLSMNRQKESLAKQYPTFWQAANLVVLYIFIQTLVDFPLALYDYYKGTDLLYNPWLKVPEFFITTVIILYLGYRYSGLSFGKVFPMKSFNLVVIPALILTLAGLQYYLNDATTQLDKFMPPPGWFMELFTRLFESDLGIWGGFVRVVIIAPVVEELIFRGVIMTGFMKNYKIGYAITLSALMFALFHLNPWQLPATFMLGLILGWIRYRTGSILACIAGHVIHNGLLYITITWYETFAGLSILQPGQFLNYLLNGLFLIAGLYLIYLFTRHSVASRRQ